MIMVIVGLSVWITGGILVSLAYGAGGGYFPPSETDVQLGKIGTPLSIIGLAIFIFGLIFPSSKEPLMDDHSHSPLGSKFSDLNS